MNKGGKGTGRGRRKGRREEKGREVKGKRERGKGKGIIYIIGINTRKSEKARNKLEGGGGGSRKGRNTLEQV